MIEFSKQLQMIRNGDLDAELTDDLAECVRAVDEQGGTATLTIKLTIKRAGDNSGYIAVTDEISKKLPKKPASKSILFATPEGTLWDDNPKQAKIFGSDVDVGLTPIENHKVTKLADHMLTKLRKPVESLVQKTPYPIEVLDKETGEMVSTTELKHMN